MPCTSATTARGCIAGDQQRPKRVRPSTPAKLNSVSGGDCMRLPRTAKLPVADTQFCLSHAFLATTHIWREPRCPNTRPICDKTIATLVLRKTVFETRDPLTPLNHDSN